MSGAGDLYRIDLDPQRGSNSLPGDVETRDSIGGSDVGANSRDDQRVRDLIEQFMEEWQILNQLNILNAGNDPLIAEFFNSDDVVLLYGNPSGGIGTTVTGTNHTVTFPGGPVRYNVGALFGIDYTPYSVGFAATNIGVDINMQLYIDGSLTFSSNVKQGMRAQDATDKLLSRVTLRDVVLLEPGKQLNHINGIVSAANMTTRLAAGDHTIRVDLRIVYTDDDFIQIDMWNEYFAFIDADSAKITSLQTYDAATVL